MISSVILQSLCHHAATLHRLDNSFPKVFRLQMNDGTGYVLSRSHTGAYHSSPVHNPNLPLLTEDQIFEMHDKAVRGK